MSTDLPGTAVSGVLRRWIVCAILFALVCITANGVSSLLGRALDTSAVIGQGTYGLALALAYTLIGGPLAVLLWWLLWRGLAGADRDSVAWGLYLAAMYTTALIVFTVNALQVLSALIVGDWLGGECATAVTWLAVWLLHRAMHRHGGKGPTRLNALPLVLGASYGLVLAAVGGGRALQTLLDNAIVVGGAQLGVTWWQSVLQALVWCAGGVLLWWWHWSRDGVRALRGGFADVALVVVGVFAAAAAALGGAVSLLTIALRMLFDGRTPPRDLLDHLALSVAALAIGGLVWLYHRRIAAERDERTRAASGLVEAGLGLIAMASGFGVVLNALLAALTPTLAGTDATALLLGGLAAFLVGTAVWFWAWRPLRASEVVGDPARRVYLVVVFGVSAITALVTLLVIAFRVFELVLDSSGGVLERVRAPLGLLVATALVAGYHFAVWRRDRALAPPPAAPVRSIDEVVLVAGSVAPELVQAVTEATGAKVVVWRRRDAAEHSPASDAVLGALEGVEARRVLVIASASAVEVVPLAD